MDDRDRIHRPAPWIPWAVTSIALVLVAFVAYNFGLQREVVVPAGAEPVRRVWVGGFPAFWFFFLLLFFVFGGLRRMWWWGYYPYRPWRYGRYYYPPYNDEREDWDEWHRRAHERMESGTRGASGSPANDRPTNA